MPIPSTTTATDTLQNELDKSNPNTIPDALRKIKLGTVLTPLKRTFSGLASAAGHDLTAIDGTGETAGANNPKRLAALCINTVRVTAGAAAAGVRMMGDSGATPSSTVGKISDDGKTITFEDTVTGFVIEYIPRSSTDMAADFGGNE